MSSKIVLVRHGRSGHEHSGWMNREQFLRWREAYEAAGINPNDLPPQDLCVAAKETGVLVASVTRRAVDSAKALAPGREILTSELLVELELLPPALGPVRLPLIGWALTFGGRWLVRTLLRRPQFSSDEQQRLQAASAWLIQLAEKHGSVMAVTHASLRSALREELVRAGWRDDIPSGRLRHWSAWTFTRTL